MKHVKITSNLTIKHNPQLEVHKIARTYKRAMKGICGAMTWTSLGKQVAAFAAQQKALAQ